MLPSLEIKNFRLFKHLRIEHLAQINLITGKNNVGKTTLLEAINIYGHQGSPHVIREVISTKNPIEFIAHLFYNFINTSKFSEIIEIQTPPISINSIKLKINFQDNGNISSLDINRKISDNKTDNYRLNISDFETKQKFIHITDLQSRCYFIPSQGIDYNNACKWWDNVELTPLEDDVIKGINIIAENIQRISLKPIMANVNERSFMARIRERVTPVSLHSLGGGVDQLFNVILAIVNSKEGMLLIDEVENGLHYSIQPDMWNLIFTLAQRLNVQVFATTHSWDCISAFQKASSEHKDVDSQLIHLIKKGDEIRAPFMKGEDLAIAAREHIEVR